MLGGTAGSATFCSTMKNMATRSAERMRVTIIFGFPQPGMSILAQALSLMVYN